MKYILSIILVCISLNSFSQERELKISKLNLQKDSLYDYGYGLEKFSTPIDSVFCYNDFYCNNIYYMILDSLILIDDYQILPFIENGIIQRIKLIRKGKTIVNLPIPKRFQDFSTIHNKYEILLGDKKYLLFYLSQNSLSSIWNTYLGILIDIGEPACITLFPNLLNTSSPLPLTDIDGDYNLDLIEYFPSKKNAINIYSFRNGKFIKNKKNTCYLLSTDGFVWKIDFAYKNYISDYYRIKWGNEVLQIY